ncbi:non-specific lipid-transfer protein-like protein At2g13820 [Punica granatum]|uniref:Bifunctional inhibitor/plant lipid transfer protein/seed storage helical domain-containing protein n=2 Tax=Punica granatum TaxID=22663 RepID=A0A218W259_PUNGR|nr:non-specific lipid-transfer protein-like protein At2g13820 [Punica granatum]OWM66855.1 hypothetical protein CDL15_Pgr002650 [Punica granatum]PKI56546.1 hypothetical protein CRG98_023072 [Punica granatum]
MASRGITMGLIFMAVLLAGSVDQAAAQSGCTTALTTMYPCLAFVTGNSSTPTSSCCSALSSVVQSSPKCLCSVLNGGLPSLGVTINQTQATQLPGACNVQTPPVSQCNAASGPTASAGSPVGAPVGAPSESTSDTPDAAAATPSASTTPSGTSDVGGGSKATPSSPTPVAHGSSVKVSLQFVLLLLFVASYSSIAQ